MAVPQPKTKDVSVPWVRQVQTGVHLLHNSQYNKGLAWSEQERTALCLHGLLPARIMTLEEQCNQCMWNISRKEDNLDKYQYLMSVLETNEKLFYNVLINNVFELMPIVYTPTVGLACQKYGYIFQQPRGMYITINDLGNVRSVLKNWPGHEVRGIVFTDGERILGLGDLGAFGMGIPVGKLALYTACAGVDPRTLLPVVIDVGTNRQELLDDEFYIGLKQERVRGDAYDALILEFMTECKQLWGDSILLQFEDFGNANAFRMLEMHRESFCTFNDDIQGTASVALAGLFSALRITGGSLVDQTIVFFGAGSAGIGIAELICLAMVQESETGLTMEDARKRIWLVDSRGLIFAGRERLNGLKPRYAHEWDGGEQRDLAEIVKLVKATALVGVSGQSRVFTEAVCQQMAANTDRPIIFPMSNPNSKAEATAADCYAWTNNRCIFASGSPWPSLDIELDGAEYAVVPAQGNNAYVFPGTALAVIACRATRVPEQVFITAARTIANLVTDDMLAAGTIYPLLKDIRNVSFEVACAVGRTLFEMNVATALEPADMAELMRSCQYDHTQHANYGYNVYAEAQN